MILKRAFSLLLGAILLAKKSIFTDLAPKSIQTRNCVGNVVWRIFRSGQRGESTRRHSFMISVGNICQKKIRQKAKFLLFIQVEFSWTKNGRFIDTTTGHVHFESKDNGESFGLESNESLPSWSYDIITNHQGTSSSTMPGPLTRVFISVLPPIQRELCSPGLAR